MGGRVAGFRSLRFPADVADRVEQTAAGMGLTPAEWVRAYLENPVAELMALDVAELKIQKRKEVCREFSDDPAKAAGRMPAVAVTVSRGTDAEAPPARRRAARQPAGAERRNAPDGAAQAPDRPAFPAPETQDQPSDGPASPGHHGDS